MIRTGDIGLFPRFSCASSHCEGGGLFIHQIDRGEGFGCQGDSYLIFKRKRGCTDILGTGKSAESDEIMNLQIAEHTENKG